MIQSPPSLPPVSDLTELAKQAMMARDLYVEFPSNVKQEVETIASQNPQLQGKDQIKDLRQFLWFSIDNDDSKDLDQLTYAEQLNDGTFKIYVAIADVDLLVKKGSSTDRYAQHNTTSVYTPTRVFSMLPEKFSTDLTSLNENKDRQTIVVEVSVKESGEVIHFDIYPAYVCNHAKLAYNGVSAWLDDRGPAPLPITRVAGLAEQLKLQDRIAKQLKQFRHQSGSLTLETIESQAIIQDNQIVDIKVTNKNRARDLIEEFMIAANISTARFLKQRSLPSLRRVVRIPKRWDRIVEIAEQYGETLPEEPNSKALDFFLIKQRLSDPIKFPDLSLTIIKLLGNGEYIVEYANSDPVGHFSLALKDYTHATAPNRRYPDLIIQRILKASLNGEPAPYTPKELEVLAKHCTHKEDDAEKVTRQMKKSAAAILLASKIGQTFDGIVTGKNQKGTWIRIFNPPIEGKLVKESDTIDVGDQIRVRLINVDVKLGFIDFVPI